MSSYSRGNDLSWRVGGRGRRILHLAQVRAALLARYPADLGRRMAAILLLARTLRLGVVVVAVFGGRHEGSVRGGRKFGVRVRKAASASGRSLSRVFSKRYKFKNVRV